MPQNLNYAASRSRGEMQNTKEKLQELKDRLYQLSKDAAAGKLDLSLAADQIMDLKDEIDTIIEHLDGKLEKDTLL
jgi:predicted  nucleic acid-binding Zn-ribbon protein